MKHDLYPIDPVDNGNDLTYRVCMPFLHRSMDVESDAEFQARIERDYAIIVRFVVRHLERSNPALVEYADPVLNGVKPKFCGQWGWARGFVSFRKESVSAQHAATILGLLREECLGNLPAWYAEEPPTYNETSPKKEPKRREPAKSFQQLELPGGSKYEVRGIETQLALLAAPEPAIEQHIPHP